MKAVKILSIAALAAATVMTSCSKDDEAVNNPQDGKLSFASAVSNDPQARATSEGTWAGTETVKVNVNGTAYDFSAASDGTLTSNTLYWNDYTSVNAYAWYPASYTYEPDQSGGIQEADFIFAEKVTNITRTTYTDSNKKLTFKHKTAKVIVTLTSGEGSPNVSVATVMFYGNTNVTGIDNSGDNPTGAITSDTRGMVTPAVISGVYTALMLPVTLSSENIFKVTLTNGQEYYYKSSYTFDAEKSYTFTIKVDKTKLTVVSNAIEDWTPQPEDASGTAN